MNIVIVEDEVAAARRLHKLISDIVPHANLLAHFESVEETVNWCLQNPHPDLFFMDIQLADGLSFEIFEHVTIHAPVIFTTAFDEYAIKAFTVNSIDYLLKPIERNLLERALNKFNAAAKNENGKLKARAFDGVPSIMPLGGPKLPQNQLDLIQCWINNNYKQLKKLQNKNTKIKSEKAEIQDPILI